MSTEQGQQEEQKTAYPTTERRIRFARSAVTVLHIVSVPLSGKR